MNSERQVRAAKTAEVRMAGEHSVNGWNASSSWEIEGACWEDEEWKTKDAARTCRERRMTRQRDKQEDINGRKKARTAFGAAHTHKMFPRIQCLPAFLLDICIYMRLQSRTNTTPFVLSRFPSRRYWTALLDYVTHSLNA